MFHPSTRTLRRSLLAAALMIGVSGPAWAQQAVCVFLDNAGNATQRGGSEAGGAEAVACGWYNNYDLDADGANIRAGDSSSAFGSRNLTAGYYSTGLGHRNWVWGDDSTAVGIRNAIGAWNDEDENGEVDFHELSRSPLTATAVGSDNVVTAQFGSALGHDNRVLSTSGVALGHGNIVRANAPSGVAIGGSNAAGGDNSVALGNGNTATSLRGSAIGTDNTATGSYSSAFGSANIASGLESNAFGTGNVASGNSSSAFGNQSQALADFSVALGFQAVANDTGVVSFGHAIGDLDIYGTAYTDAWASRLIHVADGIDATDAVNLRQLNAAIAAGAVDLSPFAAAFGGGAGYAGGVFTAPAYTIQGTSYGDVGAALAAIDGWMTGNANGVQYDDPGHATVTLDGADGTRVGNLADGVDPMDAVNKGQMDAGDAATLDAAQDYADTGDAATLTASNSHADARSAQALASAHAYTDDKFAAWNDGFTQYQRDVDMRFANTDQRIDRIGAMGSAMTHMAVNAANGSSAKGRIAVGVGAQGGEGAVSIGYGKRIGGRASFSIGASFSSGESSAGAGFGFDL